MSIIDYRTLDFKAASEVLEGKNIVFTGRGFLVRSELMRLARQAGANVESIVTKKCDILIVGEKPGSKLRKAKILGCEIITTNDFKEILECKRKNKENFIDEDILNINVSKNISESINIFKKNIVLLIHNDVIKERVIRKIKLNGGNILNNIEEESVDLIVYQPHSKINEILEKVEDTKLNEILTKSRNAHEELESEIHSLLNYHKEEQKEPDPIAKGMSFIKTNVKMGIDESDKTVANLITDGCNMGIKSLNKYLNQYAMADVISKKITEKLIRLEENLRKELSAYL